MKADQFLYWLQGWFEIDEQQVPLTISQRKVLIIKKHIELCLKYEEINKSKSNEKLVLPIIAIKGIIESNHKGLSHEATLFIKQTLNQVFKHEIDLSYDNEIGLSNENMQHIFNNIHGNNDEMIRC